MRPIGYEVVGSNGGSVDTQLHPQVAVKVRAPGPYWRAHSLCLVVPPPPNGIALGAVVSVYLVAASGRPGLRMARQYFPASFTPLDSHHGVLQVNVTKPFGVIVDAPAVWVSVYQTNAECVLYWTGGPYRGNSLWSNAVEWAAPPFGELAISVGTTEG
eukprot:m51a1_g2623 hypothetical protein (158) ;mRNA; r:543643-545232